MAFILFDTPGIEINPTIRTVPVKSGDNQFSDSHIFDDMATITSIFFDDIAFNIEGDIGLVSITGSQVLNPVNHGSAGTNLVIKLNGNIYKIPLMLP